MSRNKQVLKDPKTEYYFGKFPKQNQEAPGVQARMEPVPDCGEYTYTGSNRLEGRKALITGGDSGIGRAVAIAFAREGAQVAINYLKAEKEDAKSLAKLLRKEGHKISLIPGDISKESTARKVIREAYEELKGLDILVLNAGRQQALEGLADLTTEQLRATFELNTFAPIWMAQESLQYLPKGAAIIFTASSQYYTPTPTLYDYVSSKYALVGFSKALSKELIEKSIRVNTICPGPVWTALEISGGLKTEDIPMHGKDTPMKRAAQPVEMAGAYVYLASDESSYVTGEIYGVTGGRHGG